MPGPRFALRRFMATVLFEIIQAKGRLANPAPGVILYLPRLPAQEGLPSASFGAPVADITAKVGADKIVSVVDIELAKEIIGGPLCILDMEDTQHGFVISFLIGVYPTEVFEVVDFLRGYFAHSDFAVI